jgi:hypothetical protein
LPRGSARSVLLILLRHDRCSWWCCSRFRLVEFRMLFNAHRREHTLLILLYVGDHNRIQPARGLSPEHPPLSEAPPSSDRTAVVVAVVVWCLLFLSFVL